jgi:hypothetical protein
MTKPLMVAIALSFVTLGRLSAADDDVTVTGWVSDESCGAEHVKPGGEDCVRKCIKGAVELNPEWTPQRMVFVTDGEHEIWFVENPKALQGEEGKHLRITGTLDEEKKSVRIRDKERLSH